MLLVDQVDDQPAQLRRVLDAVLRLAEDDAEHAVRSAERFSMPVVHLEFVAVAFEQRGPVEALAARSAGG